MKHPEPTSTTIVQASGSIAKKRIPLAIAVFSLAAMLLLGHPVANTYGDHYDSGAASSFSGDDRRNDGKYDPIADTSYYHNLTQYSYVLYYGQFDDSVTSSIISVKPTLLVTNYYAMDGDTRERFAENNITVIAYLPISWAHRDIDSSLEEARQLLADGADGIFVDEAATMSNEEDLWYHEQIYQSVKEYGKDKIVIINPGTATIDEDSMLVADIICFEHDWRNFEDLGWAQDYPGWRFMGISSNEFPEVMGYDVDKESARQDLEDARHLNIAYHYSADHYIWLPPWLDVYGGIAISPHPVSDYSQQLDLDSLEQARSAPDSPAIVAENGEDGNKYNSEEALEEEEESESQPHASDQEDEREEPSPVDEEAEDDKGEDDADNEQQGEDQQREEESPEDSEEDSEEPGVEGEDEDDNDTDYDTDYAGDPVDKEEGEESDEDRDSSESGNSNSTNQDNSITGDNNFNDERNANATSTNSDPEAEGDDPPLSKDTENATATSQYYNKDGIVE